MSAILTIGFVFAMNSTIKSWFYYSFCIGTSNVIFLKEITINYKSSNHCEKRKFY